jgi:hypothetical protein
MFSKMMALNAIVNQLTGSSAEREIALAWRRHRESNVFLSSREKADFPQEARKGL